MKLSLIRHEFSSIAKLAWPILISQLAQIGLNVSDVLFSGWAGTEDLAGVSLGSNYWLPISWLIIGFSIALTTLISFEKGNNNPQRIQYLMQQAYYIAAVLVFFCLALLQFADSFVQLFALKDSSFSIMQRYLTSFSFAIPGLIIINVLRAFCDGQGRTDITMLVALCLLASNSFLNYLFVFGHWGLPRLGGAGCGIASAIACNLTALGFLLYLTNAKSPLALTTKLSCPNKKTLIQIIALATPIGLALIIEASVFNFIAIMAAQLGSVVVASHQIALTLISSSFMIPLSLAMALTIRVSYLQGGNHQKQSKIAVYLVMKLSLIIGIILSSLYLIIPEQLVSLFGRQVEVLNLAAQLMLFQTQF